MSAIWGAVDLNGTEISAEIERKMKNAFKDCRIDRYSKIKQESCVMGCGIQFFTAEARHEELPVADETVAFNADVMIDNRADLCKKLGIAENEKLPDGEILYRTYKKYGNACLNELLGAYTFVCFEKKEKKVTLVLDAVGNRCLYYCVKDDILYYASRMEAIIAVIGEVKPNKRWLLDFLAMDHLEMINETEETPYEGIYRIAPAQRVTVKAGEIQKEIYWDPYRELEKQRNVTDAETKEKLVRIWEAAVKDVLRSDGETAILLSGGLDSTLVGAFASKYLKEKEKKLFSFTAVPASGYQYNKNGYYVQDESEDVRKTAEYYGNIEPAFINLENQNPWDLAEEERDVLEMPYKSVQNCLWLREAMEKAYLKNARIILSGSYGNTTISYGDAELYFCELYRKRKFLKLCKEINILGKKNKFSRKRIIKDVRNAQKEIYQRPDAIFGKSFVNCESAWKEKCDNRMEQKGRALLEKSQNYDKYREFFNHTIALRQIGEINTKHSLKTGVIERDPTKDKRLIEFCITLPIDQFYRSGVGRRLIRHYLCEYMPPHVLTEGRRGQQSADLKYRFASDWPRIRGAWLEELKKAEKSQFVDIKKAIETLERQNKIEDLDSFSLVRYMYTLMVLRSELKY